MNMPNINPELQLYENYGLWHVPFWQTLWFQVLVGSFFVFFILLLLFIAYRMMKKKAEKRNYWQQALFDLRLLKGQQTILPSHTYYKQLTDILKQYMSGLLAIDLLSYTDHQMIDFLKEANFFDSQKKALGKIFSAGEFIKFAQQNALEEQKREDVAQAEAFVEATKKLDKKEE